MYKARKTYSCNLLVLISCLLLNDRALIIKSIFIRIWSDYVMTTLSEEFKDNLFHRKEDTCSAFISSCTVSTSYIFQYLFDFIAHCTISYL